MNVIRWLDLLFSFVGLLLLAPLMLMVAMLIRITSRGPVLFRQVRVGKDGKDFRVLKFRTMYVDADKRGHLTVGGRDARITSVGYYLRKFKADEIPQLINVLKGEMSLVGPRPELRRYVERYSDEQKKTLKVLPGITDYASIAYRNENDLLATAKDPEDFYINEILPRKIDLNFIYINNRSVSTYLKIIAKTVVTAVRGK